MPDIETKLKLLKVLEEVFDRFVGEEYTLACREKCSLCCTNVVTGATIEAYRMLSALREAGREDLIERIKEAAKTDLFRPKITTNTMAMAIMTGQDPPVEEPAAAPEACPGLEDDLCPVYEARPFSCRGMFSIHKCTPAQGGELPPDLVTLVSICWQIVEHLDAGGLYGNLLDLIKVLDDEKQAAKYTAGETIKSMGLPPTRPVPGFLVPPEQQGRINQFLELLFKEKCGEQTFRECMGEMRESPF